MTKVEEILLCLKQGLSCSQAIPFIYGPELSLDSQTALRISAAFGAGMSRTGNICGAVSSAVLVISLKHGHFQAGDTRGKEKVYSLVKQFVNNFTTLNGSVKCNELIDCDISTDEGLSQARKNNLFASTCPKFVADAARLMEHLL